MFDLERNRRMYKYWGEYGLSVRILNVLVNAGIENQAHLAEWTDEELLRLPNFGKVSLKELRLAMLRVWWEV